MKPQLDYLNKQIFDLEDSYGTGFFVENIGEAYRPCNLDVWIFSFDATCAVCHIQLKNLRIAIPGILCAEYVETPEKLTSMIKLRIIEMFKYIHPRCLTKEVLLK